MAIRQPWNDACCGWYQLLNPQPQHRSLYDQQKADVVIIGAGFVGLSAARHYAMLKPQHRVIVLEALRVGQGASGRNSGFLIDLPHKRDLELGHLERKRTIHRLNQEAIDDLRTQVQHHQIACDWEESGKYQVAVGKRGERYLTQYAKLLDAFECPYEHVDYTTLSRTLGTDYYHSAIYTKNTVLVQPAALVRGLLNTLPESVEVYEQTPALSLKKQAGTFFIDTLEGRVQTKTVLMANNIFAGQFGIAKFRMIPTMTYASMTHPLSEDERHDFASGRIWGLTPADHGGTTLRLTSDYRLLIRNHYCYVPHYQDNLKYRQRIRQRHYQGLVKRYPHFSNLKPVYTWGGACALSRNYAAYFGKVRDGVYYSGIHQSVGATRGTLTGQLLAQLALGENSQSLSDMLALSNKPALNPPEPFCEVGVRARMALARFQSRNEI